MKRFAGFFLMAALMMSASSAIAEDKGFFGFGKKQEDRKETKETKSVPAVEAAAVQAVPSEKPQAEKKDVQKITSEANLAALEMRMANNKSMTDPEKRSLAEAALKQFPAGADVKDAVHEKAALRFEQIANDPNMTIKDKLAEVAKGLGPAELAAPTPPAPASAPIEKVADPAEEVSTPVAAAERIVAQEPTPMSSAPIEEMKETVKEESAQKVEEVVSVKPTEMAKEVAAPAEAKKSASNFSSKRKKS